MRNYLQIVLTINREGNIIVHLTKKNLIYEILCKTIGVQGHCKVVQGCNNPLTEGKTGGGGDVTNYRGAVRGIGRGMKLTAFVGVQSQGGWQSDGEITGMPKKD